MRRRFSRSGNIIYHPYSLVEMLVVIAIIAILVGIGAGGYTATQRWLAKSKTESLLAKLKIAIESYKNDKGYYPLPYTSASDTNVPNFRLDVNAKDFADLANSYTVISPPSGIIKDKYQPRKNMNNFIDYGKVQDDQSFILSTTIDGKVLKLYYPKDGWNAPMKSDATLLDGSKTKLFGPIKYRVPGLINKTSFDLYSAGHDRKFASDPEKDIEDDIYVKI